MKKLFTLVLLFCSLQSFGQLTFIKEIEIDEIRPILLSNGNTKSYNINRNFNQSKTLSVDFYNDDLSFYKKTEIQQAFPFDTTGLEELWISIKSIKDNSDKSYTFTDNFFNLDNKIEFIVNYFGVKKINGSYNYYYVSLIINEDGKELQRITNLNTKNEGFEFIFSKYLYVVNEKTQIYSVPGNLPCPSSCSQKAAGIAPISQPNEFKKIQVTDFPNPSSEKVTLAYTLPEGVSFGTLRLYTQTGELVKEFKVSSQVDHLELPVSEYNSGTYFYELQAGGSSSGGKKMVVIH